MEKKEEKYSNRRKTPQAVLDLAKEQGYRYARRERKQYQGCDVYELHNQGIAYTGYPIFAVYKDGKATLASGDESEKILDCLFK